MALPEVTPGKEGVRQDRGGLAAPVSATIFEGRVARLHAPHDPLDYATGPEYRDAAELGRIVEQLEGIPVTLSHPPGLLRHGVEGKVIGRVVGGRLDGDFAVAQILISDSEGQQAIEDGILELSLGYQCKLDEQRYQREITLDHLALVPAARCGTLCSLRADAQAGTSCKCRAISYDSESAMPLGSPETKTETVAEPCTCTSRANSHNEATMEELQKKLDEALASLAAETARASKLDADLATATAAAAQTAVEHKVALDNATADLNKVQTDLDAAKAEVVSTKTALDAANTRVDGDDFRARVDARVALLAEATKILNADCSKMSDREIKVAVIKHVDTIEVEDSAVDAYVSGMYAGSVRRHDKAAASVAETREALTEMRSDAAALTPSDPVKTEAELVRAAAARRNERFAKKN